MSITECEIFICLLEEVYNILKEEATPTEIEWWINKTKTNLDKFNESALSSCSLAESQRYVEKLGLLSCLMAKLEALQVSYVDRQTLEDSETSGSDVARERSEGVQWKDLQTAFKSRIRTGAIVNLEHKKLMGFFEDANGLLTTKLGGILKTEAGLKVNTVLYGKFTITKSDALDEDIKHFVTPNTVVLRSTNLDEWFRENVSEKLLARVEDFEENQSGWSMIEISHLIVSINNYVPLRGGQSTYVEMPDVILRKKAVVNVKNNDNYCFLWSIIAALHPAQSNASVTSSYPGFEELKYEGIDFPISFEDIKKFENLNNLAINVYGLEEDNTVVPFYISRQEVNRPTIHLLAIETDIEHITPVYHFAWIKNMSRLLSSQISKHQHAIKICDRCLCHFTREDLLQKHRRDCNAMNECRLILPGEHEKFIQFKNHKYKLDVPFVIYADLECILEPVSETTTSKKKKSNTTVYQEHIPHSIAYYLHSKYDNSPSKFDLHRDKDSGEDCIQWFVEKLVESAQLLNDIFKRKVPMCPLTALEKRQFYSARVCHICEEIFQRREKRHQDHCHFTGRYRGAAHEACNLNYQVSRTIPVIFHNLSGYDSHFLIEKLASIDGKMSILPVNMEKYISFTKTIDGTDISFRFIDSFRFMPSSIEKLATNLDNAQKTITRKHCDSKRKFKLLTQKGVFPYDYVDSWEKLESTELPSQEQFYSKLDNKHITDSQYSHARDAWETFNIQTLGEYSDLYLKTDVLLLADVFENFRHTCFETYNLDPLHYYTAPGLAFDAMLKCTGAKLELLTDVDMLMYVEKGIRGGLAQCSNRFAKANNRYMGDDFDPVKEESYLMYFDVNNLYGAAMSESLPNGSFEWVQQIDDLDIRNVADDAPEGYILEVDLEYPEELQELHSDLPLCPESLVPPLPGCKTPKLMTTLNPKERYIIHYRNLKQCLNLGLNLTRIHRVLKFKQSRWLKKYIDLNTEKRMQSTNKFEENFYKLMNNAVYGKTMENVRNYRDVRLVKQWDGRYGARSFMSKPNYHSCLIMNENLIIIEMKRLSMKFNKPIYTGFCTLDLAKMFVYEFHYNYVKKTFEDRAKLMYTDTDSLLYHITTPNVYEFIKHDIQRFDTSDYPSDNIYGIPLRNKKVVGLMKDEMKGKIISEFVGLRAKLYAFKVHGADKDNEDKKRAKGIRASALKTITLKDFTKCLFDCKNLSREQSTIQSQQHRVQTVRQKKVALSWNDDKRMLFPGTTDTRPWGFNVVS